MVGKLLYIDSSAFLRRILRHEGSALVDAALVRHSTAPGGRVVSSRLLALESRGVAVRVKQNGNDISATVAANLDTIDILPLTEDVWTRASAIEQHIKTLDALHLATCLIVGADLLTLDKNMALVASSLGLSLALPSD